MPGQTAGIFGEACQLGFKRHRDGGKGGQHAAQDGFELRLVKRDLLGEAVDRAERVDPGKVANDRASHLHEGNCDCVEGIFRKACELQDAQRLIVQRDGAGRLEDLGSLVDDERLDALAA